MVGPLAGVQIVEFAGLGPCPFAGMMLADMGSQVILVERIRNKRNSDLEDLHEPIFYRGRRRVGVDLKDPRGLEIALRLIDNADALIEGYRPGVMERLGLGPQVCLGRNPRLVYGRATGWGQDGPLAQAPGHDINFIALAGVLDAIGERGEAPSPPLNLVADYGGGGMLLAFGVVSGLWACEKSGLGQVVEAAMVDGSSLLMSLVYSLKSLGFWVEQRGSNLLDGGAPYYTCYRCRDSGYLAVGAIEDRFYDVWVEALGLDPQSLPERADRANWPQLRAIFAEVVRSRTRQEWDEIFANREACVTPVLTLREAAGHPQVKARGTVVEIDGVSQPGPAPRFSRTEPSNPSPVTAYGSNTAAILEEVGYSRQEIEILRDNHVVA